MKRKINLALLGQAGSGKTAFLTRLSEALEEPVFPEKSRLALQTYRERLQKGEKLAPTDKESILDYHYDLELGTGYPPIELKVRDLPGALTADLNRGIRTDGFGTKSSVELKRELHRSDWIVFFADCDQIEEAGGWNPWVSAHAIDLLRFISDVLSDTHHKPLAILLTKTDNSSDAIVEDCKVKARETLRKLGWGASHKTASTSGPDLLVLSYDFNDPASALEPLRELWRFQVRNRRLPLVKSAIFLTIVLMLSLFGWMRFTKEEPITPGELRKVIEMMPQDLSNEQQAKKAAGRLYLKPPETDVRFPWSRIARHWFPTFPENTESVETRRLYVQRLSSSATTLLATIEYNAKEKRWRPEVDDQLLILIEEDLLWLGAKDQAAVFSKLRKKKLDGQLSALDGLNRDQLEQLGRQYLRLNEPVPDKLKIQFTEIIWNASIQSAAIKLKDGRNFSGQKFKTLYEDELPRILDDALVELGPDLLSGEKLKKLEDAKNYLDHLRKTEVLNFQLKAFHQSGPESYILEMRIAVIDAEDASRNLFYYPNNGHQTHLEEPVTEWPESGTTDQNWNFDHRAHLKLQWRYGNKVVIDAWDVLAKNEHLVEWNSDSLISVKDQGLDLPGLTFLVFKEAQKQTFGIDRKFQFFHMVIEAEDNGFQMLEVPLFLVLANIKAK